MHALLEPTTPRNTNHKWLQCSDNIFPLPELLRSQDPDADAERARAIPSDTRDHSSKQGWANLLDRLRRLPEGWDGDGAEPPNGRTLVGAEQVLRLLRRLNFRPDRIAPSAEGGITLAFYSGSLYGDVEIFNTGETFAVISDGSGDPRVWEVESNDIALMSALETIRDHVQG